MQKPIGIFYGSTSGDTEKVAFLIYDKFGDKLADIYNVGQAKADEVDHYPYLIFGSSTWGIGETQNDMEYFIRNLKEKNLKNKLIALFGLGNQQLYPHSFVDSIGHIYYRLQNSGARFVGQWPIEDYDFLRSQALINGAFIGLSIDFLNQKDDISSILNKWVEILKVHFKISNIAYVQ